MISIIIPTYNEAAHISSLVLFLKMHGSSDIAEIIVSDGGSTDKTIELASAAGAIAYKSPQKGRANQMNFAASKATGDILYFVHADTIPPDTFATDIMHAVEAGYDSGRYRTKFRSDLLLLKLNAFFTKFDLFFCYGGDQTFFITKKMFTDLNGYNTSKVIMEDYDITERAKKKGLYKIFDKPALVSARKYAINSWLLVQLANYHAVQSYKKGVPIEEIAATYKKKLRL